MSDEKLKFFASLIEKEIGVVYAPANYYQLEHRINDLASQFSLTNAEALYDRLKSSMERPIIDALLDSATNNETSFFRDANVFSGIERFVVPEIQKKRTVSRLNIWSAACSTGQEPYGLAMQLEEAALQKPGFPDFTVLCTDYSERVLKKAKAGVFSQLEVGRGLANQVLAKNFVADENGGWAIRSELKRKLRFLRVNLLDLKAVTEKFDIILCRNVLIYQTVENKIKVIQGLAQRLEPGGFLILGGAESLFGLSDKFTMEQFEGATFYRFNGL